MTALVTARNSVLAQKLRGEDGGHCGQHVRRSGEQGQQSGPVPVLRSAGGVQEEVEGVQQLEKPKHSEQPSDQSSLQVQTYQIVVAERDQTGPRHEGVGPLRERVRSCVQAQRRSEGAAVLVPGRGERRLGPGGGQDRRPQLPGQA